MAIAFNATSQAASSGAQSSLTFSHSCSGSNRILLVAVSLFPPTGAADPITGVTYGGVALTRIGHAKPQSNCSIDLWYLIAPATGANNVVISVSGTENIGGIAMSYTGAKQTGQPDAFTVGANGIGTTPTTASVTTVADNCWLVMAAYGNGGGLSAGTGTTMRGSTVARGGGFDSNGAKTPAGSHSLEYVKSPNDNGSYVIASIAPPTTTYYQSITATTTLTASVTKGMSKTLASSFGGTASVKKAITAARAALVATGSFGAKVVKSVHKTLAATVGITSILTAMKVYFVSLPATIGFTSTLTKTPGKVLASTMGATATIKKSVGKHLSATVGFTAKVTKQMAKHLTATFSLAAHMTEGILHMVTMATTVGLSAEIKKQVHKTLAASVGFTSTVSTARAMILAATFAVHASVTKVAGKLLATTFSFGAIIRKDFWRTKYTPQGDDYEIKYPHGD